MLLSNIPPCMLAQWRPAWPGLQRTVRPANQRLARRPAPRCLPVAQRLAFDQLRQFSTKGQQQTTSSAGSCTQPNGARGPDKSAALFWIMQNWQNLLHAKRRWERIYACTRAPCLLATPCHQPTCIMTTIQSQNLYLSQQQVCSLPPVQQVSQQQLWGCWGRLQPPLPCPQYQLQLRVHPALHGQAEHTLGSEMADVLPLLSSHLANSASNPTGIVRQVDIPRHTTLLHFVQSAINFD